MRRHLLPLFLALSAPGLAGCVMKQTPAEQVTRGQSPDLVAFAVKDLPQLGGELRQFTFQYGQRVTSPPPPPAPVSSDGLFPSTAPPIVVPKAVAPPTAEQVNAVPVELVKFLQTGAFDPNITPAAPKPLATPAAPANALDCTVWVRETKGCRVVLKFTKDRLDAEVTAPHGVSLAVAADYALGKDGLLFGVVTAASSPEAEERGLAAKLLAADGAPYCVRVRIDGDTLSVRDLRCGAADVTYAVLGVYKKTTAADVEKLPPVAGAIPAESNRREPLRPVVAPRSSLEAAADFARTFAAENPQLVKFAATELGRAVGGWVGDEVGRRRSGEAVGVAIGATVAAKLTGTPATDFRSVRALSYWLGATPTADTPKR